MRKRTMYFAILALALCLLVVVAAAVGIQLIRKEPLDNVQFRETKQGMALTPVYDAGEDTWYLYLPSHAGEEDLQISAAPGTKASLEENTLHVETPLRSRAYPLEILQCTNLPTLSIDAEEGTIAHIYANLDNEKDVFVTMLDGDGSTMLQQVATLSGRGNGTWDGNKRPFNLNFSNSIAFGPFREISELCLLAEAYDESKLRNSLAYYGGRELDIPYTSEYMHCNLYINGEYRGLYGISTKQEYVKHLQTADIQGVFEYTFYPKRNQFYAAPLLKSFRVMYGDMGDIRYVVESAYEALMNQDWQWCAEIFDYTSFAQKYVLDEFFANDDMGVASQYYYIDSQNVIHCMLPWDYDWSMGSTNRYFDLPPERDILANRFSDYWVTYLLEAPDFRKEIAAVIEQSFTQEWIQGLKDHMQSQILAISDSLECDAQRWGNEVGPNTYGKKPDRAHLLDLQEKYSRYFPARRDFLLDYYQNRDAYCSVSFQEDRYPAIYLPKGAQLQDYLGVTNILSGANLSKEILSWHTETGLRPEDVGAVEQDITFLPTYGSEIQNDLKEPAAETSVLDKLWLKMLIVSCVGAVMAILIVAELRHGIRKREEVAV